jgi:hypothetical protein
MKLFGPSKEKIDAREIFWAIKRKKSMHMKLCGPSKEKIDAHPTLRRKNRCTSNPEEEKIDAHVSFWESNREKSMYQTSLCPLILGKMMYQT